MELDDAIINNKLLLSVVLVFWCFCCCCCVALRHRRGRQDLVRNGEIVEVLAANASQNIVSEALV